MTTAQRRIGLFGGTFDPPHAAHVALATLALRELALDELRWIPAGEPWQKSRMDGCITWTTAVPQSTMIHSPLSSPSVRGAGRPLLLTASRTLAASAFVCRLLVPDGVARYIEAHHLYQRPPRPQG